MDQNRAPPPPPTYNEAVPGGVQAQPQPVTVQPAVTVISAGIRYTQVPVSQECPHCHNTIVTTVTYENGTVTYLAAGIVCLVGCWMGCCLIPFCIDACKDAVHCCPNCNIVLGKYSQM
ncbi:lipopolysaccharide-induced tumor necrosis factor-alpha factor homolog [Saccoglossus kowalevskii]|uniref:Lipopolysaccharide-induced tumor necrosis factor-alpha factor homolog n=1 Tax=Saccoglossus kowalevskii TaxID=10224 RepID=A0ABM0GXN3_SACKO|nr:PREDICTED: lipopolysaccharide-induced tumor necrosis factor-alpha factor homolog [Saccoglossus kowalevskii]